MVNSDKLSIFYGKLPDTFLNIAPYLDKGQEMRLFKGEELSSYCSVGCDDFVLYILKGQMKLEVRRSDESFVDFVFCSEGSIIQMVPVSSWAELCDHAQMVACENSVVYLFSKNTLLDILSHDRDLLENYLDQISNHLLLLRQRYMMTSGLDSDQRVLGWISHLCMGSECNSDGVYEIPCTLTQQQIAEFLFIHVTTCNRMFSSLKKQGIVTKTRTVLIVRNYKLLMEFLWNDSKTLYY